MFFLVNIFGYMYMDNYQCNHNNYSTNKFSTFQRQKHERFSGSFSFTMEPLFIPSKTQTSNDMNNVKDEIMIIV